jgi:hypothetical protein
MPLIRSLCCLIALICGLLSTSMSAAETSNKLSATSDGSPQSKPRPKPTTPRERAAARRALQDGAAKAKREEDRTKWLAKLKERDVEPWPEDESDEVHAAALAKSREMVKEVVSIFPGAQLYETEHFLFVSNIPAQQVGPYIASLDRMYDWMCRLYGVPREHKVWLGGKAPIFAFLEHGQFDAFEERYYAEAREALHSLANIYGLCHMKPTGEVVISCFRGNDPNDFAQMLVHETSHGFIHRYKTKAHLPNWVDEGMADLIGAEMAPASMAVKNREYKAILQLAQQPTLGGMLTAERIGATQYGMASNLNRFLLQTDRNKYVRFIEALKEGQKWEDALRDTYQSTPEELLAAYGRRINVAELRP